MGRVSRHGPGDHIHTGAVVVSGAHQQCEQHHQSAADQHPHPPVGGQLGIAYAAQLHGVAEQGRHQSAQDAQGQQLYQCERMKGRYALDDQCVGRDAEKTGHQLSKKGGEETGDDGGIVHDAHALHLHGKDCRANRGAKEGGKTGGHPSHGKDTGVPAVQLQPTAQLAADAAANLERGSLPSGAAARSGG